VRYLIAHPKAKAKAVCAMWDERQIKGLEGWYPPGKERQLSLERIYEIYPAIRQRIDTFVTKRRREADAIRLAGLKKPL